MAMMAIVAGCTALSAYLLGTMINAAYVNKNYREIVALGLLAMAIFTVKALATYGSAVWLSWIGNRIVADNQQRMFDKLLQKDIGYFADRHSSEFIVRLSTGAAAVSQTINLLITAVGRDLMSLIGLSIVMVTQDPIMSIAGLIIAPPALIFLRKMVRRVRGIARTQISGSTRIVETMQEALQGLRMVKAFGLEDEMRRRLAVNVAAVESESNKMARVSNRASPMMEILSGFTVALAIMYGGYRVIYTGATPGEFFAFLTAFLLAYEPAKRLARLNLDLNNSLVGVRILYEVIDSPAGEPTDDDKPALTLTAARLDFDDVHFSYQRGTPVLRGVSFTAERGAVTALVGASGGGKSTVLNLILRFYDVDSGRILIDGQNIAAVSRRSLRQQVAYVGQIVHMFRGTIRDNIALGKLDASEAEIVAAAKAAHAHDFIVSFPARLRLPGRRARLAAVGRPAPARRHCARLDQGCAHHPARRSDRLARFGIRARGAGSRRRTVPRPHHTRHRPPALHHHGRRLHPGGRERPDHRVRPSRRIAAQRRPLRLVLPAAAQGAGVRAAADRRRLTDRGGRRTESARRRPATGRSVPQLQSFNRSKYEHASQQLRHCSAAAGRPRRCRHR